MSVNGLLVPSKGYKPSMEYLGGLFDGEGSVTITHRFKDGTEQFYVALSLSNTDKRVLEWLQQRLNGSIHTQRAGVNYVNYNWYVSHKSARRAIEKLAPVTHIKKNELLLAAEFYDIMQPLGYAQRTMARWNKSTDAIHAERLEVYEQFRSRIQNAREENRTAHTFVGV